MLKRLLRGRLARWAYGCLPPAVGDRLAKEVSRTGHKWDVYTEGHIARSNALKAWAMEQLRTRSDIDMVVLSHSHLPLLEPAGPGRWYANTGDWVVHRSY